MDTVRETLGHYEILGPLGSGGMGDVFVARDPILGRKVALKVLPARLASDRDSLSRFTQEARSASALNHPNIVTIHEVGTDKGTPFIVMEFIDGRDLRSIINEGPQTNRRACELAAQIADGLAAAHDQGIIHRDLKPENIMLTKDGYVKILDFGLAKVIGAASAETDRTVQFDIPATNPGTILGTVGYMSPEQATGKRLDFRSDQFAFGAILYELLTGKAAFECENAIDTLSSILHDTPPPIRDFNVRAVEPLCWIIDRLISKEPAERYTSTRDLAVELRALRDRLAAQGSILDVPRPPALRQRQKRLIATVAAALVFALLLIGTAVLIRRQPPAAAAAVAQPQKTYLAVLRFKDLTGQTNGQAIVDGFAETLATRLARFPALQVMRSPKPDAVANATPQQAARELGANVVLTGSMMRNGDRLRVTYAVSDIRTGKQKGDLIEGSVGDLFAVQDRVADSVAAALSLGAAVPAYALDPQISQQRFLEALGYLRRYDDPESVDKATSMLSSLGNSATVQASLGRAYLYKFQLTHEPKWADPAREACERALKADPQSADVHVTLGELKRQTGHADEAIKEYKQALTQNVNNADAILGLASTYGGVGNLHDAEVAYKKSIELQPNYWGAYNKLGAFYAAHGRYDDSVAMFKRVIELVPDNERGYNNLGGVYLQMARYDDAVRVSATSIQRKPSGQAYSNLGTGYFFLGRFADAARAYEEATALTPSYYLFWANLGDANRLVPGHAAQAAAAYDRAIQLALAELKMNEHDPTVNSRVAVCLARRNRLKEAQNHIDLALGADGTNPRFLYGAAVIANVRGDAVTAERYLREALLHGYSRNEFTRDPEFAALRDRLMTDLPGSGSTLVAGSKKKT
jgi:tetratricopeptide (TPR) repeat protein/predicted Ser/Thr protein kinase